MSASRCRPREQGGRLAAAALSLLKQAENQDLYCLFFPFIFSLLSNVNGVVCGFSRSSFIAPATAGSLSFQMSRPRVMSNS